MTTGSDICDPPAHEIYTEGSPAAWRAATHFLLCSIFYGLIVHLAVCTTAAGQLSTAALLIVSISHQGAGLHGERARCQPCAWHWASHLTPQSDGVLVLPNLMGRKLLILRT